MFPNCVQLFLREKKKGSTYGVQGGLELQILLPQPLKCYEYEFLMMGRHRKLVFPNAAESL
jgi:hypothetical protein